MNKLSHEITILRLNEVKLYCLRYCFTLQQVFESKSSQWSLCSTLSKHITRSVEYRGYLLAAELLLVKRNAEKTMYLSPLPRAMSLN